MTYLYIDLSEYLPNLQKPYLNILSFLITFLLATLILIIAQKIVRSFFKQTFQNYLYDKFKINSPSRIKTISELIQNGLIYLIYFIYCYQILTLIGIPIGTLLAGAGIFGVAIGLGAKDLIIDIINGFFIIFEEKFQVGELIEINNLNITGTILSIGLRTTKLKSISGEIFFIPNSEIRIINNMSRLNRQIVLDLPFNPNNNLQSFEKSLRKTTATIIEQISDSIIQDPIFHGPIKNSMSQFDYRIIYTVNNDAYYRLTSQLYQYYLSGLQNDQLLITYDFIPTQFK